MVVRSRPLERVLSDAARVAPTVCPVLILGERGVGKELLARHLHAQSRRSGRLVAINCAAIPAGLAESTLFGHARGAFTGASAPSQGLVREAARGTLFLDEVGELSQDVQARLLRLLQEGVVQPVGEPEQRVDVRIVAATNRDLDREVEAGRFRADLRDRLHGVALRVPPLRERRAEIMPLARHFLATAPELAGRPRPTLSAGAGAVLRAQPWPGNVRELRSTVVRAAILGRGGVLTARQVREALAEGPSRVEEAPAESLERLDQGRTYTMGELVALLASPRGTVKRRVAEGVERGVLEVEGEGRRRRYRRRVELETERAGAVAGGLQGRVLDRLRAHGLASTGELSQALEVPLSSLKRAARALLEEGLIAAVGSGRATRLRVVDDQGSAGPGTSSMDRRSPDTEPGRTESEEAETRPSGQEQVALELAGTARGATARAVAAALGRTVRTAERVLARLVGQGRLRPEGYARARRYLLPVSAQPGPEQGITRVHPVSSRSRPRFAPEVPIAVQGEAVAVEALRTALILAASPEGVTATRLARRGGLSGAASLQLLRGLGAVGLLTPHAGDEGRWTLLGATSSVGGDTS